MKSLKENKSVLLVQEINNSGNIEEALGITEERSQKLVDICTDSLRKSDSRTEGMVLMSRSCTHANELIMMGVWIGEQLAARHIQEELLKKGISLDNIL